MAIRSVSIAAPSLAGGGMVRVHFIAELLRYMGIDTEIVVHRPDGRDIYPVTPEGLSLRTVSGRRIWHYAGPYTRHLTGDAIIAVKPRTSSFGVALLARAKRRQPLVLDMDDWEPGYGLGNAAEAIRKGLMDRLVGMADAITVNNHQLQARYGGVLLRSGRDGRIFDPSAFDAAAARAALGLRDRFVLMFPGTVVTHSGIEDLLTAVDMLNRPDIVLVIVGGRASGRDYVKNRLSRWRDRILLLPEAPRQQLPALIAAAHLLVVPHRDTVTARCNFPMKLVDGMAMGKPILTTRVGDIPLALGDESAYLVRPSMPMEMAEALQHAIENPAAAERRGRNARLAYERSYSLDALAPVMESALRDLASARKR